MVGYAVRTFHLMVRTAYPTRLINNALPLAPMNQVAMLTGYVNPAETSIADPNQDVVYVLNDKTSDKPGKVESIKCKGCGRPVATL